MKVGGTKAYQVSSEDTEYFDIVAGVLQGDMLAPYLFINCLDYVLRTSIDKIRENDFELTKKKSRRYPRKNNYRRWWHSDTGKYTQWHSDTGKYANDIVILANTPNQVETLLHSLELSRRRHWPPCQCTQNWIYVLA